MEALADHVIGLLGSSVANEFDLLSNFQDDLEAMRRKVAGIRALLRDAESKSSKSKAINVWLQNLKHILLDAEDLLDAYSAEELARKVMTEGKGKMAKEVRIFFSKSNKTACAHEMGRKIRAIRKKLDEIYDEKNPNPFQLQELSANESHEWRRTDPFISDLDVVGRDAERKDLVSILLSPDVKSEVSVVPIVGMGGSGKTTLAQLVYNDASVKNHFELMKWVCVSDETHELSNHMLAQKIIGEQASSQRQDALEELRHQIEGKLFLLVLDDVWNIDDRGEWLKLENLFRGGRKGSMIIVTTRSLEVANTTGTHEPLSLKGLNEEESWKLFCTVAFRDGKEPESEELRRIGKDIVRKCAGVPLAIRTLGSLLFTKQMGVREWSSFEDHELANIDFEKNGIIPILKLSYDYLPSYLKNCFAFCSLFPKDHELERQLIIRLWIAEGFIEPPKDRSRCLEDVGDEYFMQLLSRCLFQDVMRDDFGDIVSCKMHDLIHDLALLITTNECYILKSKMTDEENFPDGILHLSSYFNGAWIPPSGNNVKTKKLRTILSPTGKKLITRLSSVEQDFPSWISYYPTRSITSLPKRLRVLVLINRHIEIPNGIGDLKHLRYLHLCGDQKLEKLPRGVTKLFNLLSLRLDVCRNLIELPKDMRRLVRLRHLELNRCYSLASLPKSIGNLTSLQEMSLQYCNSLKSLPESLGSLTSLQKIMLHSCTSLVSLPESIGSLTSLREITLHSCTSLTSLPESFGSLTSLQKKRLHSCNSLTSLPKSIGSLTSLREIELSNCTSLASLPESIGSLTSLQEIELSDCTSLTSLPESIKGLTSLQHFGIYACPDLIKRYGPGLKSFNWPTALAHILEVSSANIFSKYF